MLDQNLGQTQSQKDQKQEDLYFYTQSWVWRAVEALVLAKDFDPSPRSIANRLNISVEAAVDALDGLVRLGAIYRDSNTFKRNVSNHIVSPEQTTKEKLLSAHTNIATQILPKLNTDSIFTTQVCLGKMSLVKKHADKLVAFLDSLDAEGRLEDNPDVISIEISITSTENKNVLGAANA